MLTLSSLTNEVWFQGQSTWLLILIAILSMVVIIYGADRLVESAADLARRLGIPPVIIGATIVSLGTTAPETAVSVLAAFNGNPGLALGNGVGSIIADTGLILGIGLLMTRLPADRFVLNRQGWVQIGSAVLLAAICYGLFATQGDAATLPRMVGVLFMVLLVGYLAISAHWAKQHPMEEGLEEDKGQDKESDGHKSATVPALLAIGFIGLIMVIGGGDALVNSVTTVAARASIPDAVIAATFVALGTSLPELVVGITAIRKGHAALMVGNVIGADVLNILFVIGASCLAAPLPIVSDGNPIFLTLHLPTMLLLLVLMRLFIFRAVRIGSFDRWMGIPMVLIYVGFVLISFLTATS